ncbi:hypothetical protein D3C73_1122390 [compost metagenome]
MVNREKYNEGRSYLPGNTVYSSIEGGNHGQFGSYGPQKGDGVPTITEEEQQARTAQAMLDWLGNLR